MTELELFAKATLEQGGKWWTLEQRKNICLCMTKSRYLYENNYYYDSAVYQVFKNGNRIFASTNFFEAFQAYKKEFNKQEGE